MVDSKVENKEKGVEKMHIAIYAERMNVVSLTIKDEDKHDTEEFRKMVLQAIVKDLLSTVIRGTTARATSTTSPAMVVRRIKNMGLDTWKGEVQYGKRWSVYICFYALKRTVGEIIMAKKLRYQIQEAVMKIYAYFLLRNNSVVG